LAFDTVQLHSEKRFYNPLWKVARLFNVLSEGERRVASSTKVGFLMVAGDVRSSD
jgi:hypothetical protein